MRLICAGDHTTAGPCRIARKHKPRMRVHPRPVDQRFGRGLLLFLVAATAGEDAAIRHRNLSLADAIVIGLLGAYSADLNFVTNLKRVGSPSLPVKSIGRT